MIFLFILAVLLTLTVSNAVLLLKSTLLDLVRLEKKVEKPVCPNIIFSVIGIISLLGGYALALDMVRGARSVWTTIGFYPIALLTLVLVVVGTVLSIYSFAPFVCQCIKTVSYTHLRAHETGRNLVCRLLLEKKKKKKEINRNQS